MGRIKLRFAVALALFVGLFTGADFATAARLYTPYYGFIPPPELIGGFDTAPNGSLTPIAGSPFSAFAMSPSPVSGVIGFAFGPDGSRAASGFLFKGGVQGFAVDGAGAVTPAGVPTVTASTTSIAVSPDGRFVYAPTREFPPGTLAEGIRIYAVGADGSLASSGSAGSGQYADVALTPNGRFLYATAANKVERFAVNADGSLMSLGTTMVGGPLTLRVSADGRFLFVAVEQSGDGVASFSVGPDGSLTQNGEPALTGDVAINIFGVAPGGRHLYMPDSNLDAIVVVAIGPGGVLEVTGKMPVEDPKAVEVSPDGRFLYYQAAGSLGGISVAAIAADGTLTPLPSKIPWDPSTPNRLFFQPQPTPVASFKAAAAAAGTPVAFNATSSQRAVRFDWNFGDGSVLADGGPTPSHVYAKPGVYPVTLTVTDAQGCSNLQIYTGQSTECPGGSAATATATIDTLPVIEALTLTKKKFRAAGSTPKKGAAKSKAPSVGTAFRYRLSEASKVRLEIERRLPGRRVGTTCKKPTKSNAKRKSCARFQKLGPLPAVAGKAGGNTTKFSGRLKGKPLSPGPYRVTAVATDPAGGRSAPRSAAFRVIAP